MHPYRNLKEESLAVIRPYIENFILGELDLDSDINTILQPMNSQGLNGLVGYYAITYAILLDNKELAEDLCANGVDLSVKDPHHNDKTPLELAVEYGRGTLVSLFIKNGAELEKDIKVPSSNPCSNPFRFFWSLGQSALDREVNYELIEEIIHGNKAL